jgi:predicted lipoprotein with Yx(FWY)xxD motif
MKYSGFNALGWVAVFLICLLCTKVNAQWSVDPAVNNIVTAKSNRENSNRVVSDGSGGAIVVWWDDNMSGDHNIYAQRIGSDGSVQWTSGGIGICTNSAHQQNPEVAPDGSGGVLIAWFDQRNVKNEIFLQRVKSDGTIMWNADGVSVGTVANHYQHSNPAVTYDGSGGAIVTWEDWRNTFESPVRAIYAQRISASGSPLWGVGGKLITSNAGTSPDIISDGNGGAIIAWDLYVSTGAQRDIYVQRINSGGDALWTIDGVQLCSNTSEQRFPKLVTDGSNGAIIIWEDFRNGSSSNLYAQKVNSSGTTQWASDGVPVSTSTSSQTEHRLMSDGSGGTFVIWQSSAPVIFAQRLNSSGNYQWDPEGIGIGSGQDAQMERDGSTGAIITWSHYGDIMAQRVNSSGSVQWGVYGVTVCNASSYQMEPHIALDESGGAVIVWDDSRNDILSSTDIYAQRISSAGSLGLTTGIEEDDKPYGMGFTLEKNYPNPFSGSVQINFSLTIEGHVSLKIFSSEGSEVRTLVSEKMTPGSYSISFDANGLTAGTYYCRMKMGTQSQTSRMILLK